MSKNYRYELVGAFGCPIDENPTGVMEEAAFRAENLNYRYLPVKVEVQDLKAAIEGVRAFQMKGINLTIPHKVRVLEYLDELSPAAQIIGAVNMVVNRNGWLFGENTDGKGFLQSLADENSSVLEKNITILGAGGAARAIAVEAALAGASKIYIINRDEGRGKELVELIIQKTQVPAEYVPFLHNTAIPKETDILINATSVGLYPDFDKKPDIDYDTVKANMTVTDVVFNPPQTLFLTEAMKRGAKAINGLGMLVNQGALNFEMWTGIKAPVKLMEETLRREFNLISLQKIHHIAIIVSDYEKSKEFYTEKLGFEIIRENCRPKLGDYKLDLRLGDCELEIFAKKDAPERLSYPEACGLRHLAFQVENIEEMIRWLNKQGIETEPIRMDDFTGKKMTFFHDPDGLPLELHE